MMYLTAKAWKAFQDSNTTLGQAVTAGEAVKVIKTYVDRPDVEKDALQAALILMSIPDLRKKGLPADIASFGPLVKTILTDYLNEQQQPFLKSPELAQIGLAVFVSALPEGLSPEEAGQRANAMWKMFPLLADKAQQPLLKQRFMDLATALPRGTQLPVRPARNFSALEERKAAPDAGEGPVASLLKTPSFRA